MRLTQALYVRQLLAKIHPPLPKTPRESQQLLQLLDTSFRKRLDDVHPAPQAPDPYRVPLESGPPDPSLRTSNATNYYLNSILTHPLLGQNGSEGSHGRDVASQAVESLDQAIKTGQADLAAISEFASQYVGAIKGRTSVDTENRMGHRLSAWYATATPKERMQFLTDPRLLSHVVPTMYSDGLEEIVWDWLRVLYERDFGHTENGADLNIHSQHLLQSEDYLVSLMMKQSVQNGSLNDAAQQYIHACEYRATSRRSVVELGKVSGDLEYVPLVQSWKRLSISVLYRRSPHVISAPLFDKMLQYSIPFSHSRTIGKSFLTLYHPTTPSSQLLHQKLRSSTFVDGFLSWQSSLDARYHKLFVIAILDAAQLSLKQDRPDQAQFFLNFAQLHYPKLVPGKDSHDNTIAERVKYAIQKVESKLVPAYGLAMT